MSNDVIKVKSFYNSANMVTYVDPNITLDKLNKEVSELWQFSSDQLFTIKWIDDEGDPCIISCQEELDEMLRLHDRSNCKEPEVVLHVFENQPMMPGMPCPGEDGNIYRRGAIRWREKTKYKIYGHIYEPKRLKTDTCAYCQDKIWGLGSGGFKCGRCKLMVHKKCHKLCKIVCGSRSPLSDQTLSSLQAKVNNISSIEPPSGISSEHNIDLEQGTDGRPPHYRLEDFELLRVIGRGSYAKVLMVELKRTKRIYAMKVIKKEMFVKDENEDIDWVQTEKHVFERASNYPFLVGLHSCFQNESRLFFVIEFVRGGDLMYHMQRKLRLEEAEAKFYAAEISLALDFLHMRGIIYRDLKLDNVLLDHEGHIKLTDYGMCKEGIKEGNEKTNTFCGTPNYISPELLRGEDYDFSVDWWALGVLLYEMLAGKSPFNPSDPSEDALFQTILEKTIRIPRALSVQAQNILKKFLKKDPKERLGCNPSRGRFAEIKADEFFKDIDWDKLERRQVKPPYTPPTESDRDLAHFDPDFTKQPVCFTPDEPGIIAKLDQSEFEGFEYVNPLLMSVEDVV